MTNLPLKIMMSLVLAMSALSAQAYSILPTETDQLTWHQSTVLGAFANPLHKNFSIVAIKSPRAGEALAVRIWKTPGTRQGLIIVFPGTGANADSAQAAAFASSVVSLNYDVLIVANPFSLDFQRTFSPDRFVGFPQNDSAGAVKMVEAAYRAYELRHGTPKKIHLAGISLGGTYALRFASLPTKLKFDKHIAINPPVTFANAIEQIDDSIRSSLNPQTFPVMKVVVDILLPLADLAWVRGIQLNALSLEKYMARLSPDEKINKAIIGASFQESLKGITKGLMKTERFADLYTKRKLERDMPSITFARYMGIAGMAIQDDYIRNTPFTDLIADGDLDVQIENAPNKKKLYVIHSEDDFLLAPGDLARLERVMSVNLQVLKSGGHCGALWTKSFSKAFQRVILQ